MNRDYPIIPEEIRLNPAKNMLLLKYADGSEHSLSAEFLRVESPSAEVQGHGPGQAITVSGKRSITITSIEPVGHYALKLTFSDGHDTGLFTWPYLMELGVEQETRWQSYLEKLAAKNLSRD